MALRASLITAALGAAIILPTTAQAARSWVVPSTTVLSGSNAWVTIDAASSDDLFFPDLRPLRLESVQVIAGDGQVDTPQNGSTGKFRSTFDVQLTKPGTYKIASVSSMVMASWTENGEVKRFRGTGDDFAKQAPAGAADLKTIRMLSRNETFVTRDKPTTEALKPSGQGLELLPITHPSDVVATQAVRFQFLLDGKPAAGLEVVAARGGDRWRPKLVEITAKTGADGVLAITLPEAGMWWLSAVVRTGETGRGPGPGEGGPRPAGPGGPGPEGPAQPLAGDGYSASYTATIEAQLP